MKKALLLTVASIYFLLQAQTVYAQIKTYQFEQIDSLQKIEKRNILIFIHTDWCKYCKMMQNTTFKNDHIIKMLNEKYYFITLNAEEKRTIFFNNHTFSYKPTGTNTGSNELTVQLGTIENKLSFPTLCVLNANNEIIFQYPQYITTTDLKTILTRLN